jgi:ribonuclease PH
MNVVMTGAGRFVELQGTGEEATFDAGELAAMIALARKGIAELNALQHATLGRAPRLAK